MQSLLTVSRAQEHLRRQIKAIRISQGYTQAGLAARAGVSLPSLRKFEQKGLISLESLLKILVVLGYLESIAQALDGSDDVFNSITDVLEDRPQPLRKRGWRT